MEFGEREHVRIRRNLQATGCCLGSLLVLSLFATISPYWVWRASYSTGILADTVTISSGPFTLSSSTNAMLCGTGGWYKCRTISQANTVNTFNNTMCSGDFFAAFSGYGFCSNHGANPSQPGEIVQIQSFSILTNIFIVISLAILYVGYLKDNKYVEIVASVVAFCASICACCAFAIAASFNYYKQLTSDSGWYLPMTAGNCTDGPCIVSTRLTRLFYGPSFYSMIVVFFLSLICSIAMFVNAKNSRQYTQPRVIGEYGTGCPNEDSDYEDLLVKSDS